MRNQHLGLHNLRVSINKQCLEIHAEHYCFRWNRLRAIAGKLIHGKHGVLRGCYSLVQLKYIFCFILHMGDVCAMTETMMQYGVASDDCIQTADCNCTHLART